MRKLLKLSILLLVMFQGMTFAQPKINVNTASKSLLMKLPGVGEGIAELIMRYREEKGSFRTVDELIEIPGINEVKLDGLKKTANVGLPLEKNRS